MSQDNWLVLGGAGYIGSHLVSELVNQSIQTTVVDDLSTGFPERLFSNTTFFHTAGLNFQELNRIIRSQEITVIVHFAARREARESMLQPVEYWDANTSVTLNLMRAMRGTQVHTIHYASSCSVYGNSGEVDVNSHIRPESVYARTKFASEEILKDCATELNFKLGILRYFNVVGASESFNSADRTRSGIIPSFINSLNQNSKIQIFGNTFDTLDGTAERDYVDVRDVIRAHQLVHAELSRGSNLLECNVSSGESTSVLQMARLVMQISGIKGVIEFQDAAKGDPGAIWAGKDPTLSRLGWNPQFTLEESIKSHILAVKRYESNV